MENKKEESKETKKSKFIITDKMLYIAVIVLICVFIIISAILPKIASYIIARGIASSNLVEFMAEERAGAEKIDNQMTEDFRQNAIGFAESLKENEAEIIAELPEAVRNKTFLNDKQKADYFAELAVQYANKMEKGESIDITFKEVNAIQLLSFLYNSNDYISN